MSAPDDFIEIIVTHLQSEGFCGSPENLYGEDGIHILENDAWLYYRQFGIFKVGIGYHTFIQAFLYATFSKYDEIYEDWKTKGYKIEDKFFDYFESECFDNLDDWSEKFLSLTGSAILSNVCYGEIVMIGDYKNLTRIERDFISSRLKILTIDDYYKNDSSCLGS